MLPHGQRILSRFKNVLRQWYAKHDYQEVITPIMVPASIWQQSGHLAEYKEDMYFVAGGGISDNEN